MNDFDRSPKSVFRWVFEDRTTGKIVIGQTPNLPLLIYVGALAARLALKPRGSIESTVHFVETGALTIWSLDEIVRGVNPFRRIGGALVLVAGPLISLLR